MTNTVSASRLAIADPRHQASKDGPKGQSDFQDAFRSTAERRGGRAVAVQAVAGPSTGLSRQLEGLAQVGLRLSGTAAIAPQVNRSAEATVSRGRPVAELPNPVEGDLDRTGRSGATKQVRAEASPRVPAADLPAGGIAAPTAETKPGEPKAAGGDAGEVETQPAPADDTSESKPHAPRTAAEDVVPAFALLQDALRIPRRQTQAAGADASASAPSPALDTSRADAEATSTSSAPKSAAASPAAVSPPPPEAATETKAKNEAMAAQSAAPREVPVASTPTPSIERTAVGTIAVPTAQPNPRSQVADRTGTRANDSIPRAASADRTMASATDARSPADAAAAAPRAETADRTPPPREPVEREAKDDGGKPGVSDFRSGETARPAPNGVTAVSAQSAQAAAPTTPAAAIIATVRAEGSWAAYFRETQPSASAQLKSLKIQLNPVELGAVTAHLRIEDETVTVELSAETADAQRQLTTDADTIAKSLRALGLDVDRVTVQVAGRSDAQPQPEPNGQSRQQGFAADGGAGGAREQGSGSRREQQQSGAQNTHAAGPPGAGPNRSSSARYI